ncbi:carbohydrate ABC transporter permease [Natronosalvus rutilus]|uniref:Carbohydrate ABC transporter permease n=1 Tax=Natronosalvus rutilus TaxID=2953753 RepID=A0A9E7N945_9EURY|nr:carbohydrate ABC transporter permease [Natronosalvus rutilus]UTF52658.1 carbohydrate ABC transporter permease [Natronosalvus rutilus]
MSLIDSARETSLEDVALWDVGKRLGFYGSILAMVSISMFPVFWILLSSLKPPSELFVFPQEFLPYTIAIQDGQPTLVQQFPLTLENYRTALQERPVGRYLINSAIVASATAFIDVVLGAMAGYALSRLRFPYKLQVLLIILFAVLLPFVSRLIPLYKLAIDLQGTAFGPFFGLNQYLGLILPYAAFQMPFAVWIFQAYFNELPASLEEAGLMDGLSRVGVLFRIILPVSMPAMATTAIIVFIYAWNEFLFALTFMTEDSKRTITVGIALFGGQFNSPWGTITAAVFMSLVPLMVFMLVFQKKIVEGMTAGVGKA